jgi:hypothetical protein
MCNVEAFDDTVGLGETATLEGAWGLPVAAGVDADESLHAANPAARSKVSVRAAPRLRDDDKKWDWVMTILQR